MAVETLEQSGSWLWGLIPEKESFAVAYVKGFYLADVWKELMANLISQTSFRHTLERVSLERLLALGDERGV